MEKTIINRVAKSIVDEYETKLIPVHPVSPLSLKDAEMRLKYMTPEKPCCNLIYLYLENEKAGLYTSDLFRKYPRNPKLKYRPDGEIDNDPKSRIPNFCDYNAAREMIRIAKMHGNDHAHFRTSRSTMDELMKDGIIDHYNNYNALITWKKSKWF